MRSQKQKFVHNPDGPGGEWGDCFRTCIAVLLELDRDEVPHFSKPIPGEGDQTTRARAWLKERGMTLIVIPVPGESILEDVISTFGGLHPGLPFVLSGQSMIGCNHSVVASDKGIICDPSGNGLVGPSTDGYWWLDFIGNLLTDKEQSCT